VELGQVGLKRAAELVVDLYGDGAIRYATQRVVLLRKQGDLLGATAWQRVLPMIQIILRDRAAGYKRCLLRRKSVGATQHAMFIWLRGS
jgi:hypothetical protein